MSEIYCINSHMKTFVKFLLVIFVLFALAGLTYMGYGKFGGTYITAVFEEATPFPDNMYVYYKGFKIGHVDKIMPNGDYTATLLKIRLYPNDAKIPENVSVTVKSYKDEFDYVDIIVPDMASTQFLKDGSEIKGVASLSIQDFFNKHIEEGTMDMIIMGLSDVMQSLNETIESSNELVQEVTNTVKDVRPNIVRTGKNLSDMSQNVSSATLKFNNTLKQDELDKTVSNLEQTSENIKEFSENLNCGTKKLSEITENINCITQNASEISSGLNKTLRQPMGGARAIFGKAVK